MDNPPLTLASAHDLSQHGEGRRGRRETGTAQFSHEKRDGRIVDDWLN
jgi:hypothetical protein